MTNVERMRLQAALRALSGAHMPAFVRRLPSDSWLPALTEEADTPSAAGGTE